MIPKRVLRCEGIGASRCSRLQRRFCACLLAVACVCLFVACIHKMPPSAVLPRWRSRSGSFLAWPRYGLLYTPAGSDQWNAGGNLPVLRNRKLLVSGADQQYSPAMAPPHGVDNSTKEFQVQRMGPGAEPSCSLEDIAIVQGEMGPMPDGIPSFAVQILNLCLGGCPIADIHVSCGWFASATLVNPALFKRVAFDDCVVKDGHALAAGETLTFQYANSFQYPFSLSSASFTCPGD